jgi:hypothetical protein
VFTYPKLVGLLRHEFLWQFALAVASYQAQALASAASGARFLWPQPSLPSAVPYAREGHCVRWASDLVRCGAVKQSIRIWSFASLRSRYKFEERGAMETGTPSLAQKSKLGTSQNIAMRLFTSLKRPIAIGK